ncbi:MAG: 50S ribosomal protein L13 [Weeksellaceae bacterium]|nr:50S ribosomal protein L13 [Weeksellaceae bacterium]
MDTLSYKTISANKATANKEWLVVDAEGQSLGRLASKVAKLLRGKHKPNFTPHDDCGDNVIVINAEKVVLTGNKWNDKIYQRYTGYPGGLRETTAKQLFAKDATRLVESAVKGMLPKNKLGRKVIKNIRVYGGDTYEQVAQQPREINLNEFK